MDSCTLETPDGTKHEIPIYEPVLGPKALDGQVLSKKSGYFTYDPGFTSTQAVSQQSPTSMETKDSFYIEDIQLISLQKIVAIWRWFSYYCMETYLTQNS